MSLTSLTQLEGQLSSYTRYSTADRPYGSHKKPTSINANPSRQDTPRLALSFEAKPQLHVYDTSYCIVFTITRVKDDPETRPCIIHWDPITDGFGTDRLTQPGMILLWRQLDGWQPLEVDTHQLPAKPLHPREVCIEDPCFEQLDPGASVSWSADLPSVYLCALN